MTIHYGIAYNLAFIPIHYSKEYIYLARFGLVVEDLGSNLHHSNVFKKVACASHKKLEKGKCLDKNVVAHIFEIKFLWKRWYYSKELIVWYDKMVQSF